MSKVYCLSLKLCTNEAHLPLQCKFLFEALIMIMLQCCNGQCHAASEASLKLSYQYKTSATNTATAPAPSAHFHGDTINSRHETVRLVQLSVQLGPRLLSDWFACKNTSMRCVAL